MNSTHRGTLAALLLGACAPCIVAGDVALEVRDAAGNAIGEAVVYATPANGTAPPVRPATRARIDQVNKEFVPRVNIVQTGTEVQFPNSDNIRHSIYSFSPAKVFTTKLYAGRDAAPVLFDKAGVIVLGCNIHDRMVAWVYVVDTPWFARSSVDGSATLKARPPGDYHLTAAAPAAHLAPAMLDVHVDAAPARFNLSLAALP